MSREIRHEQLRGLMEQRGLGAILLQRPANFAWYTDGADNRVDHADPLGVAAILLTAESEHVVCDNIEAPRMREEETPEFEVLEHPWHSDSSGIIGEVSSGALGTDHHLQGSTDVSQNLASMRYVLDDETIRRYWRLGADVEAAIEEVVASLEPEMDEYEATASLVAACRRRGIFSPVAVASSANRISRYRHPIPRGNALGGRVMIVVCAERGGLYANLTRIVYFEEPDTGIIRLQQACENILRRLREATSPGRTLAEVFGECKRFYAEEGLPGEWKNHHQGGITGYASREVVATPETGLKIQPGMAFAWNPSATGAKAEETFILTDYGPEVITGA